MNINSALIVVNVTFLWHVNIVSVKIIGDLMMSTLLDYTGPKTLTSITYTEKHFISAPKMQCGFVSRSNRHFLHLFVH